MASAARIGDVHACPSCTPTPHVGGPVIAGAANVVIGGLPAARVGDKAACPSGPDLVVNGSPTVFIGGKPAARVGDTLSHGGVIAIGCPSVFIGDAAGSFPREGAPPGTDAGPDAPLPKPPLNPGEKTGDKIGGEDPTGKSVNPDSPEARKRQAEENLTFATFLGAPASMELIRAVLGIATGLLADLGAHMTPGARAFLGSAIESARQTLALKQFALLTEQLATLRTAMQDAAATVPTDDLKESAAKAAEAAGGAVGESTSGPRNQVESVRPKLVVTERPDLAPPAKGQ